MGVFLSLMPLPQFQDATRNLDFLVFGYEFSSDAYPGEEDPPNFLIKLLERFPFYERTWVTLPR